MTPKKNDNALSGQNTPDPHPAEYYQDLEPEFFVEIEKLANQNDLKSNSTMARCFDWRS